MRTENEAHATRLLSLVQSTGRGAHILAGQAGTTLDIAADCSWAGDLNRLAMADGITLVHLAERRSTLEEAFFEITGGCARAKTLGDPVGLPERMDQDAPATAVVRQLRRHHGSGAAHDDRDDRRGAPPSRFRTTI